MSRELVVVIDNGSRDDTVALVRRFADSATILRFVYAHERRPGKAREASPARDVPTGRASGDGRVEGHSQSVGGDPEH